MVLGYSKGLKHSPWAAEAATPQRSASKGASKAVEAAKVSELVAMGFSAADVRECLKEAKGGVDEALELLLMR